MDSLEERMDSIENRMESLENRMDTVEKRMESMDNRLKTVENRIEIMDKENKQEFTKLNAKISQLDKKIDTIYTQVANNTEHQAMIEHELKQMKQQTSLDQKVAEIEIDQKSYYKSIEMENHSLVLVVL